MRSQVVGLFIGIAVVFYAFTNTSGDSKAYYDFMSLIIVIGGSIAIAIMTSGFKKSLQYLSLFFKIFKSQKYDELKIVNEIVDLAKTSHYEGIKNNIDLDKFHPFTQDGIKLLQNKFDLEKVDSILFTMLTQRKEVQNQIVDKIESLAKYPPALGMMGTIIGLVAVLKSLNSADSVSEIGPSMAVALITTLYGILLSNYILLPIADNIRNRNEQDAKVRNLIAEGLVLIAQKNDPIYIREAMLAHLSPSQRDIYFKTQNIEVIDQKVAA